MSGYDHGGWWTGRDHERPDRSSLYVNWPNIERHPRLVVDELDDLWLMVIEHMLERGKPFTVVRP